MEEGTSASGSASGRAATSGGSDGGSQSQAPDAPPAEHEYLLYELETADSSSIGLVLRAIYDGGDVQRFMRALERKIKLYDRDIEKLCSYHYHGFIEAIRELLDLKTQCNELRGRMEAIDSELVGSSKELLERTEEVVRCRRLQRNIAAAVDAISITLPLLEKYSKLTEQMDERRYYPALKTLEQLEHTYLPQAQKYRFAQKLMESVKDIRKKIKDASFSEFTDFLENIRKVSAKIGETALRQTAEFHDMDSDASRQRRRKAFQNLKLSSNTSVDGGGATVTNGPATTADDSDDFSAQEMVDFSPVYRCCHIFTVLGSRETFDFNYRKQREEQALVMLRAPEKLRGTVEAYLSYFHEVIGFFVVEHHIQQTAAGLVIRSYRDKLWEYALQQITKTLNANFGNCTDPQTMLKIKKLILIFALTLKGYGFQVSSFYKLLQNFRDQYNEILMAECSASFSQIVRDDNYSPIVVKDEKEFRELIEKFPFYQRGLDKEAFPRRVAFSAFVPLIFGQLKAFARGSMRFMEGLGLSQSEVDDTARRYTNVLLERLSAALREFLDQRSLALAQLVQVTINMGYLEKSCESLDEFISTLTSDGHATLSAGHVNRLKHDVFRDTRSEVEQRIDSALRRKITDFLDLANYQWELSSSSGRPSDYIMDMIAFLQSTFLSFNNLPPLLARHTCMQACKYVAGRLMRMLLDSELKSVSVGALEQINLDVIQCELFASRSPVEGLDEGTLGAVFAELRQLLDLCMAADWAAYLADHGRDLPAARYARVPPHAAIALLDKMVECERRKNTLFGKGVNKDRKKLLDTVLKQLRTLQAGNG